MCFKVGKITCRGKNNKYRCKKFTQVSQWMSHSYSLLNELYSVP
jgi:hypothetical protein